MAQSLREQHTAHTRSAIVNAFARLVAERGPERFTLQEVADEAGVAIRTLHRHFASRDDLWQGVIDEVDRGLIKPTGSIDVVENLPGVAVHNFAVFSRQAELIRALIAARAGGKTDPRSAERTLAFRRSLEAAGLCLDDAGLRQLTGILRLIVGSVAWERLTDDEIGLTATEAGEVAEWAFGVIVEAARKETGRLNPRGDNHD